MEHIPLRPIAVDELLALTFDTQKGLVDGLVIQLFVGSRLFSPLIELRRLFFADIAKNLFLYQSGCIRYVIPI
jgi:hypothetical protein